MKIDKDFVLEIIKLFRPRFHNRIALIIIVFGFSLIGQSLAVQILNLLLEKQFSFRIIGQNDPYWGMALIVVALFYNSVVNLVELKLDKSKNLRLEKEALHDKEKYSYAQNLFSEIDFKNLMYTLENSDDYYKREMRKLDSFMSYFSMATNDFLSKEMKVARDSLLAALKTMRYFLGHHFFIYGDGKDDDVRFCLYPEWNMDRGGDWDEKKAKMYDDYANELYGILKDVKSKYKDYINTAKRILII